MAAMTSTVVVCVDESDISEKAFRWYLKNFYTPKNKVVLCHVPEYWGNVHRMMSPARIHECIEETRANTRKLELKYDAICKEFQIDATFEVRRGQDVWHEICKYAESINADSIVVGSRGMSSIKRALLGSVSNGILHHINIPVLIYKDH